MNRVIRFSVLIVSLWLAAAGAADEGHHAAVSPDGKARLIQLDGIRVLQLSGSHYEMGYNHGYLLAREIMDMITVYGFFVVDYFGLDYDELLAKQKQFAWGEYEPELEGMLAGLRAALPPEKLLIAPPGKAPHAVGLDDLKGMNTMGDWLAGLVSCSSFSVWGKGRADGSTLLARNFDWLIDPGNVAMDRQVVIAYAPDYGPRWVNVTMAGDLGCISGMNEYGASAMIHVSLNGYPPTDDDGFVPGTLALRRVIESLRPASTPAAALPPLRDAPQMGQYLYHLCFPSAGRADDDVAGIFEYDGNGRHRDGYVTYRRPADNPRLPRNRFRDQRLDYTNTLINVNHYLKRKTEIPQLFSSGRYLTIKRMLPKAKADGNVEVNEARDIMAAVGYQPSFFMGPWITLHTVVFEPQTRRLHLFLAQDGRPGYDGKRFDAPFEAFFAAQ